MKPRTQARRHGIATLDARNTFAVGPHWFLTGPASAEDLTSGEPRILDLVTHAKSMGTNTSACGLTTTTWTKLWDTPFEAAPLARRCPLCVTHVASEDPPAPWVGRSVPSHEQAY